MKKPLFVFITAAFLSGCSLVPPILTQIGYIKSAIDAISYATTKKGTADHAISAIKEKDCALHRILTEEGNVCNNEKDDIPFSP